IFANLLSLNRVIRTSHPSFLLLLPYCISPFFKCLQLNYIIDKEFNFTLHTMLRNSSQSRKASMVCLVWYNCCILMEIMKRSLTTYFRGESSLMHILSAGVHYEKTPIEIREKIVFPADTSGEAMKELTTFSHIHESVILSTCNRTEIYVSTDDVEAGFEAIEQFISEKFSIDVTAFKP